MASDALVPKRRKNALKTGGRCDFGGSSDAGGGPGRRPRPIFDSRLLSDANANWICDGKAVDLRQKWGPPIEAGRRRRRGRRAGGGAPLPNSGLGRKAMLTRRGDGGDEDDRDPSNQRGRGQGAASPAAKMAEPSAPAR